jgi:hypothetical protein
MSTGLGHDRGPGSVCCLVDCTERTSRRRWHGSFLAVVVQNSFPSFQVAHNHRNQCYAPARGNCIDCHYSEKALEHHLALEFSFAAQACENTEPPSCSILQTAHRALALFSAAS